MDIAKLAIKNFLTISEADLELDSRGLLLIQGENADDTSAKSNGAGKSSIVDALCWALYGETARGVSGDAVINDVAKKDCQVTAVLEDGLDMYIVQRHRKHKTNKNALLVHQVGAGGALVDLSKGTDKETQEVVNKIMGCSLDVFKGAVYAGQEAMPDLPGMTDKQLKLLIEEAAGVEELADAYTEARSRHLTVQGQLKTLIAEHGATVTSLEGWKAALAKNEASQKEFEGGRKDRARAELAKIPALTAAQADAKDQISAYDVPALERRRDLLNAELAGHKTQQNELDRLERECRAAATTATSMRATLTANKQRLDVKKAQLADIDSQVGKPCGECGKAYCAHDLEAARKARSEAIATATEELRLEAEQVKKAIAAHKACEEAVGAFKDKMTDVSAASMELAGLNGKLAGIASMERAITKLEDDVSSIKAAAKLRLTEPNIYDRHVAEQREEVARIDALVHDLSARAMAVEEQVELYAEAVAVFGPAGVRAHILDTVTPFLNEKTGEYLGALADGNIHATWSTLAKTSKGELKEKFNIEVSHDKGGKSFAGLSGGEKRKVRLASAMALQDMVASRATKPINIFIADEVDHALDEPGLERLMGVLEKKAKERGTVMVISHNALGDWIDNVIHVKKSGGVSTVSGATARGF